MAARRLAGLVLAAFLTAAVVLAAPHTDDQITAAVVQPETANAIHLDGDLSDSGWRTAEPVAAFVQREPNEGAAPSFRTEARVLYDQSALYVAVRADDPEPERILGFLTRRDAGSASDWIHVYIDSYHDRRTAYEFAVNPVGVKRDAYWFDDSNSDDSWDAVWEVVVGRDAGGWHAEFRIPYSQLRFKGSGDGRLGFAVVREIARLSETSTWPLLSRGASGYVSSFGELTGVALPGGARRLELVPYTVAEVKTVPGQQQNPLQNTWDPGASVGVDLKYAVTPALSLTATVNPDFGQVEADPAEVNLSAFETFFAEKRPFFIEGSGTYQMGCGDNCSLFYSRRIGRSPRGSPTLADGEFMVRPGQSTILGAGKLTGRVGSFSVGMLTAVTQEERARLAFGDARRSEIVEPGTLYSVSRVRREFADRSSLGFMLTTTNRKPADSLLFLPDAAVAGAVDYDWRLGGRWSLSGHWAGTSVTGSPGAITSLQTNNVHSFQRPDAEHLELDPLAETLNGNAGRIAFTKIAGDRTRMTANVLYKSPGFELNDLGFLQRADEIWQNNWLQVRFPTPGRFVRNVNINFNQWSAHNFGGDTMTLGGNVNAHWTFQNLWSTGFGVNGNARTFDDRKTRGGPGGYRNPNMGSWQYFNTNDRLPVSLNWNSNFGSDWYGVNFTLEPRVVLRPASAFSAELGVLYSRNIEDAQWVENVRRADGEHYVFGHLDQTTTSITVRLNYTLTPNLSVQIYGQPFVSAGHYDAYKELVNGRADRHDDRYASFAYGKNADFNVLSFRTTNVLRWEFKPGSTMFVVWQQGREGRTQRGDYRFGRDYNDVFSTPAANALIVKLAYWINP